MKIVYFYYKALCLLLNNCYFSLLTVLLKAPTMRILHITDYHLNYSKSSIENKQGKIVTRIIENLKTEEKIDFVIFSGDLVNDGERSTDFLRAKEILLDRLLNALHLDYSKLFICPGNHDINRKVAKKSIIKYLDEEIKSNEELNNFVIDKTGDYEDSLKPSLNYFDFVKKIYPSDLFKDDIITELYSAQTRLLNNKKIGIVSINSAWRAVGGDERGMLLFPISKISEALNHISQSEIKIILYHHPLSYFREFNEYELDDFIHNNFDISFSGHIHKNSNCIILTANDGIIKLGASAALAPGSVAEMGYSVVKFDFDELKFEVHNNLYDKRNEIIYSAKPRPFPIPSSIEKEKQNKFRKTIRKKIALELKNANDLFISSANNSDNNNFLDLFTPPSLRTKSATEYMKDSEESSDIEIEIDQISLDEKDYLILGPDKCGKSSLLRKIQLDLLKCYSVKEKTPFYINSNDYKSNAGKFDVKEILKGYFESTNKKVEDLIDNNKVVLLIDNYNSKNHEFNEKISEFIRSRLNIKLIVCADETFLKSHESISIDGRELSKIHFHKLRKKHILLLAEKWPELPSHQKDEIVQKIDSIFTRLAIPFNYWTVSLFLWIFKKSSDKNFQNDFGLIDLYIESLIERDHLIKSRASFGYEKYKKYLAYLSAFLYLKHSKTVYSATHLEILKFTESHLKTNPRNDIEPREIFEYLEKKGILKQVIDETSEESVRYTFRLNGVFEYFLAFYMTFDPSFKEGILNDNEKYLAFANEFEMYAGFTKNDKDFLKNIFTRTQDIFSVVELKYKHGTGVDGQLREKITESLEFQKVLDRLSTGINTLSSMQQYEIEEEIKKELGANVQIDNSDIALKKKLEINRESSNVLEKSLQILGRVYKNSDDIDDTDLIYEVFDYILLSGSNWGFKIIDEAKIHDYKELSKLDAKKREEKLLLEVITKFIPMVVQSILYEILGQRNVSRVIKRSIENAKSNEKENQYKLFLLHFLLIDIDLQANYKLIDDVIKVIKMPALKYSVILKLNYYLAFKTNGDKILEQFLRAKIQEEQLNFDNETDKGSLHAGIENTAKKSLKGKD